MYGFSVTPQAPKPRGRVDRGFSTQVNVCLSPALKAWLYAHTPNPSGFIRQLLEDEKARVEQASRAP
jgi:hypothetical protein